MITRIKLRNWKSHLDSELSFSKGVNALIGIMGSGKTSVMQAIAFALFGTFSGVSSRRIAIDDLIMKKPQEKGESSIELEFVLDGRKYEVKRTVEKGKGTSSAEIREEGKLLEVNPQGVTREVSRILQMDYDLFQRAVYSEQNAMDYFLQIPKGKRMQQIDSMLKLDRYEKAREAAVSIKNRIAERRKEKLRMIEDLKERKFEERIRDLESEIKKRGRERERLKGERERLAKRMELIERKFEKREDVVDDLRNRIADLNGRIIYLQNDIKERKERFKKGEEIRAKFRKLKRSIGEKPEDSLRESEKSLEGRRKEYYSLETMKSEILRSLEELESAGERCPVCESKITREKRGTLISHRKAHMEGIEKKMGKLSKVISKDEKELEALKERVELLREIEIEREGIEEDRKKIAEKEREVKYSRKKVTHLVELVRKREAEEKGSRKALQEIVAKEREVKTKLESLEEITQEKNDMLKELKEERDMFLEYVEETKTYERITDSMDSFVFVLRNTQDQLRDEFLKTVNYIMSQVWNELYPYGDFSEIRILVEKDYVLQLKGTRGWVNVDLVSGGERSLASLALRIAFSLAFTPNLRWLILDEPTHNLDVNAIEHFGGVLRDRMENIIDQVFLITHEERLSDYITGSIYKLERDKKMDGITKIIVS
ncbi:MAG: AAA family ATPase [Candidatus Aenigmarchaeota archaeon]|nr:AAA family ATPase [Candidatus Aenigmarchaeota archaeon]